MGLALTEFPTRAAASEAVAEVAARALGADIAERGRASLFVSGGSTPEASFRALAATPLDWARVTVGLVDERWVTPNDAESNERLVRLHLLHGRAGAAGFLPMWMPARSCAEAAADRDAAYAPHCAAASFVLLGMGADGHTASWFPGMLGLADVATSGESGAVAAVTAPAARTAQRMTLTGTAISRAKAAALLVFGDEKRAKLETARKADPLHCPVRFAIDGLGDRLKIMWAP
jgi:6-phosphogluconolactonase